MKERILKEIEGGLIRKGSEGLRDWLVQSDYFEAPASTVHHDNSTGGLAKHSWKVYRLLIEKNKFFNLGYSEETLLICGLFHDLCKVNFYVEGLEWKEDAMNNWVQEKVWKVDDGFPIGHGEKSVIILARFIELTIEETCAIRWHMLAFDPGIHFNYPSGFPYRKAISKYPLVAMLATADLEATYLVEGGLNATNGD